MKTTRLTDRQRELLRVIRVEDNLAVFDSDERIPDWAALKKVMLALGGKWKLRTGFVFPDDVDAAELVRLAVETGEILDPKAYDFFETPPVLADRVVLLAGVRAEHTVLEPSAGRGALALAAQRAAPGVRVTCGELLPANAAKLDELGLVVHEGDFLSMKPTEPGFDRIIMNPPFSKRADIHHERHALRFLKPDGRLVAIMSAGVEFRQDRLATEFRELVTRRRGLIVQNPQGSFLESGTGVCTVTVVIHGEAALR